MNLVFGALLIVGIGVLVVVLAVIAIAGMTRSRGKHGTSGSFSSAALEIQSLLEPEKKRVVETMRARKSRRTKMIGYNRRPDEVLPPVAQRLRRPFRSQR